MSARRLWAARGLWLRVGLLLAVVVAGLAVVLPDGEPTKRLTVTFPRTVGLYEGAAVKVLGVDVGRVDDIEVVGTAVRVDITYDADVDLPADVRAVIVPPSIVGDRFVQLTPAHVEGAVLPDGAELDVSRASVPLELDETYAALDDLSIALGPDGANEDGALADLVTSAADALGGNGRRFRATVDELAAAMSTAAGGSEDFAAVVASLHELSTMLVDRDDDVRRLVSGLSTVGTQLAGQRTDLVAGMRSLRRALDELSRFTRQNRSAIGSTLRRLTDVSSTLAAQTDDLAKLLEYGPLGLTNVINLYIPTNWDVTRPDLTPVDARTGSVALRWALFEGLGTQVGHTILGLCKALPPLSRRRIGALCDALADAGGDLAAVLADLARRNGMVSLVPRPTMGLKEGDQP